MMASKSRIPPPHLRRPHPGPDLMHSEPFRHGMHVQPGGYPPFEMLPPPEVLEQKLATQGVEMERLLTENQRLAATHGTLRQHLAAAQQELQMLQGQVGAISSEREQQMKGVVESIAKMEAELEAAESVKLELQQAHVEAQGLVSARQDLVGKVQQLTQDLQKTHADLRQMPSLMSELDYLRQEYHNCRASYEYEKKLYSDHLESLQEMEKNYMTMAREVDKLRSELNNTANADKRAATGYVGGAGYSLTDGTGHHPSGLNTFGAMQGRGPHPTNNAAAAAASAAGPSGGGGPMPSGSTPTYAGSLSGQTPSWTGYDGSRGPNLDAQRVAGYGPAYDLQGRPTHSAHKGTGYDTQRGLANYDMQRLPPAYDAQRTAGYGSGYDAQSRVPTGTAHASAPPVSNVPYGSVTTPTRAGNEPPPRGGNQGRR